MDASFNIYILFSEQCFFFFVHLSNNNRRLGSGVQIVAWERETSKVNTQNMNLAKSERF